MQEEQKPPKQDEAPGQPAPAEHYDDPSTPVHVKETHIAKTYDVEGLIAGGIAGIVIGIIVSFDASFALIIGMFSGLIIGTRIKKEEAPQEEDAQNQDEGGGADKDKK